MHFRLPLRAPSLAAACFALLLNAAHAQALPGGAELGMSPQQLQQAVASVHAVPRPARLAGGLTGGWTAPDIDIAGVPLAATFFFAEGQLRRVEYLAPSGDAAAFDTLLAWGRAAWGAELASHSPEGDYATWAQGELDAYLQRSGAQVRLVIKRRVVKDDTEL